MSLGLDTSVVVRLLVGEPASQYRSARERLQRAHAEAEPVLVTDLVVVESYFALRHHYGVPEEEARTRLAQLLSSGVVDPSPPDLGRVLALAAPPGLADHLIHHRHAHLDATTVTFDRVQAGLEATELL
ncbi:MAG: PIN domain-containing protein [Gemmatimonadota bacterium]